MKITTKTLQNSGCISGDEHKIIIEGHIGPDSRHAIYRLLETLSPCKSVLLGEEEIGSTTANQFAEDSVEKKCSYFS